jgi:hypothetical protein
VDDDGPKTVTTPAASVANGGRRSGVDDDGPETVITPATGVAAATRAGGAGTMWRELLVVDDLLSGGTRGAPPQSNGISF